MKKTPQSPSDVAEDLYKEEENPSKRYPNLGAAGKKSGDERGKPMTPACNEEGGVKRAGSAAGGGEKLSLPLYTSTPHHSKTPTRGKFLIVWGRPPEQKNNREQREAQGEFKLLPPGLRLAGRPS